MSDPFDPRLAWQPYQPNDQNPWDLKKVGHLYRRAAFGANWSELETGLAEGPTATIEKLLSGGKETASFEEQSRKLAASIGRTNNGALARAWWLQRMLYSPYPLQEKLTLFWHNHFATSNAKINNAAYMLGQYDLMREHAQGNFRELLQAMSKDPAMLIWLDTNQNKKGKPNENYARELMELFSLGIGHYTEKDIREAARAFTGWEVRDGKARFNPEEHDATSKTVLNRSGTFKGEDIVRICLDQPACPRFIVGKLYRFLISEAEPASPALLQPLADQFRKSDWDFGSLVRTMLRSNLFFSPMAYRSRIKSPVDFAIGIIHALEGRTGTTALAAALESLGQSVFYPPSVKGWDGAQTWLNGQTLLFRQNLALALTSTQDPRFNRRCDPAALVRKYGHKEDSGQVDFFLQLFLQGDVGSDTRENLLQYLRKSRQTGYPFFWSEQDAADQRVRALCHLVLTLPEYQLD